MSATTTTTTASTSSLETESVSNTSTMSANTSTTTKNEPLTKQQEIDAVLAKEKEADVIKKEKIIAFLQGKLLVPTIEIAKHLQPKNYRAKQVNDVLYQLLDEKRVVKTCKSNGGNPRWSLA